MQMLVQGACRWWVWLRSSEVQQKLFDPAKVLLSLLWARSTAVKADDPAFETLATFFDLFDTELASQVRLTASCVASS